MNQQISDLDFLELMNKASSKDFPEEETNESPEDNPETEMELDLPSGVWRTNLFIEG